MKVLGLALVLIAALIGSATAHDWYPYNCCSGYDCRPLDAGQVIAGKTGFIVLESGEIIPYGDTRIKLTPMDVRIEHPYHRCSSGGKPEGRTICLYVPSLGM